MLALLRPCRRSGTGSQGPHRRQRGQGVYSTAVWAHRVGESFWVGLPYGTDVDWLRNVRAAGGCEIEHDGVRHRVVDPVVLPLTELPAALGRDRTMLRLMGVRAALRVDIEAAERPAHAVTPARGGDGVLRWEES